MLRHGLLVPEFLYQVSSTSRYTAQTGVPPLLLTTLPHLTSDYEALYDEVRQVVSRFPPAWIAQHYARLFRWMTHRLGREVCVERSAFSLPMVRSLAQLFPTAKFVHLVRDGRACALSMSRHLLFRLVAIVELQREVLGVDPYYSSDRTKAKDLNEDLRRLLPEQFDVDVFWNYQLPLEVFGSLWTAMLIAGIGALLELPEERVLTLTYEQFLAQPQTSIKQLIAFIDPTLLDETWVHLTATQIRQTPLSWQELPSSERKSLEAACQPGLALFQAIAQEGLHSKRLPDLLLSLRAGML